MSRIAMSFSLVWLLAFTACEAGSERATPAVMLQAGLGIAPAAIVDPPPDTLPTVIRRVWTGFNAHWLVSPSRDLRFVALTDWSNGDVAVRNMETGEIRHVTDNATPYASGFALRTHLSPDGSQIAYGWWHNERALFELRLVDFDGGEPRILKSDGFTVPYAWSPDGRFILATHSEDRFDAPAAVSAPSLLAGRPVHGLRSAGPGAGGRARRLRTDAERAGTDSRRR
jgi:hypothetical protein